MIADELQRVVSKLRASRFFGRKSKLSDASVGANSEAHLLALRAISGDRAPTSWCVCFGDGAALAEFQFQVARESSDADGWSRCIGESLERARSQALTRSGVMELIVPPLWPMTGLANVVEPLVVADVDQVLEDIPARDHERFWKLACQVEKCAWGELWWELSGLSSELPNPFRPILQLAEAGIYPVGAMNGLLVAFAYR